ncbi:MAG: protein TonB [Crocinitomicaceae bacterium]|jgi:protein TonB
MFKFISVLFFLLSFGSFSQDSMVQYYDSGELKSISYINDLRSTKEKNYLPVVLDFYKSGNLKREFFEKLSFGDLDINYLDTKRPCPTTASDDYANIYKYENCVIISKTGVKEERKRISDHKNHTFSIPYSVDRGTFKNYILDNGTISYYSDKGKLITTIQVKSSRRINDPIIHFKDDKFKAELLSRKNKIDLNHNNHIEVSEASIVSKINLDGASISSLVGLSHFKNLETIEVRNTNLRVKSYASHDILLKEIIKVAKRSSDPRPGPIPTPLPRPEPIIPVPMRESEAPIQVDPIVDIPDKESSYVGGQEALNKFIENNMVYPETAKERLEQGCVYVRFVVEKDGLISTIEVVKGVTRDLDEEAKRVTRKMPKLNPALVKGRPVRSKFVVPFNFVLRKQ